MDFVKNVMVKINAGHASLINTTLTPQPIYAKLVLTHFKAANHARMDKSVRSARIHTTYKEEDV